MTCTHNHSCGCGSLSNANIKAVIEGLLITALDEIDFDVIELKNSIHNNLISLGEVQDKLNDFKADMALNLSALLTKTELASIKLELENLIAQQQGIYEDLQRDFESATSQKLLDYKSDVLDIQQEVADQLNTVQNQLASLVPTRDAYKIAVQNGFVGSEASWLDSLKGHSAYTIAKAHGFKGSEAEWLSSLKGDTGPIGEKGVPGNDGISAYEVAKNKGFVGSESQWLNSLIGEKGDQGVGIAHISHNSDDTLTFLFTDNTSYTTNSLKGEQGIQGPEAKSVYDIAVSNGFRGDERDWLNYILENSETVSDLFADADSLEKFVNGSDSETVLTRLSAEYPTLQKAIKQMFESGGLPATPFDLHSELKTSELEVGSIALVLNDPNPTLNGYYTKQPDSSWELTKFNPVSSDVLFDTTSSLSGAVSEVTSSLKDIDIVKSHNLIDTQYYNHYMARVSIGGGQTRPQIYRAVSPSSRLIIQRIEPNTTYTVKYSSPNLGNHFRLALFENSPNIVQPSDLIGSLGREELFEQGVKEHTFTTGENDGFMALFVSDQGQDPKPQLELGSVATDYVPPTAIIRNVKLESLTKDNFPHIVNHNKNLFHGHYRDELLYIGNNGLASFLFNNFSWFHGKLAAIKVEGGKQYTISFHPDDWRLVNPITVACAENLYPSNRKQESQSTSQKYYPVHHLYRHVGTILNPVTVTVPEGYDYLYIYVSNQGHTPRMQVEEGSKATEFIENKQIIPEVLEEAGLLKKASYNVFDGKMESIGLLESLDIENSSEGVTVTDPTKTYVVKSGTSTIHGRSAIVRVKPNTTYAVSRTTDNGSGFVKVAAFKQNPVILDSAFQDATDTGGYLFGRTIGIDTSADKVLVRTEEEETYLVIHLSETYTFDMIQVTEGIEFKEIKAKKIIPNYLLDTSEPKRPSFVPEHSSDAAVTHANNFVELPSNYSEDWWGLESLPYRLKKLVKYNYNVDLYQKYYRQGPLKDFFPGKNPDNQVKVVDVHAKYHALVDKYPEYFSKTFIGKAESDYDMYRYETKPVVPFISKSLTSWIPDMPGSIPLRQPTFFITSGIHGNERAATYSVYYFFEELLENPQEDPLLDWIKNNVKFVIVPAVSPSGFDLNRYGNVNMNLNRDFPPYGEATQAETRIAMQQITEWADKIDFHYDFHNSAGHSGSKVGYALTDSRELAMGALPVYQDIGKKLSKEFPEDMTQDPRYIYGWTSPANIGTIGKYSQEIHGIRSMIFETYRWGDKGMYAGMPLNNELVTRVGVDLMFHMVLMGLREIIK